MQRLRNIQQLGDHIGRKWVSELRKDIYLAALAERYEQKINDFLNLRPQRFDCSRREAFVHEFAKARMLRSVEEQHPEAERAGEFGKFFLFFGWKLVNETGSTLGRESGVAKKRRAICMLENG